MYYLIYKIDSREEAEDRRRILFKNPNYKNVSKVLVEVE